MNKPYLYIRTLRHADHTVFCVQDGQKRYYNSQFNRLVPFASGQQAKRSMLDFLCDELNVPQSPITFNYVVETKKGEEKLKNREPWSPCDPSYPDQLLGGWMMAKKETSEENGKGKDDTGVIKRRSPLSISALRPLHPLLSGVNEENATFDRSSRPEQHPVRVTDEKGVEMSKEEISAFLDRNQRTLSRRTWIPELKRADGLFVHDIAIDKRTLFSVSLNPYEPEVSRETVDKLKDLGWMESRNVFGSSLVAPQDYRSKLIEGLATAIVNWRVNTNQSRTFSIMEILALGISENASALPNAIRARLIEETDRPRAEPVLDYIKDVNLFITPACEGYVKGVQGNAAALSLARECIVSNLKAFDYEKQLVPVAA